MISMIDWSTFWLGLATGVIASLLFFAGLAMGIRYALQHDKPAGLLFLSAAVRIALLLGFAMWVAAHGLAAACGFALAFFMTRLALVTVARSGQTRGPLPWN